MLAANGTIFSCYCWWRRRRRRKSRFDDEQIRSDRERERTGLAIINIDFDPAAAAAVLDRAFVFFVCSIAFREICKLAQPLLMISKMCINSADNYIYLATAESVCHSRRHFVCKLIDRLIDPVRRGAVINVKRARADIPLRHSFESQLLGNLDSLSCVNTKSLLSLCNSFFDYLDFY